MGAPQLYTIINEYACSTVLPKTRSVFKDAVKACAADQHCSGLRQLGCSGDYELCDSRGGALLPKCSLPFSSKRDSILRYTMQDGCEGAGGTYGSGNCAWVRE